MAKHRKCPRNGCNGNVNTTSTYPKADHTEDNGEVVRSIKKTYELCDQCGWAGNEVSTLVLVKPNYSVDPCSIT